jgi:glucokinase
MSGTDGVIGLVADIGGSNARFGVAVADPAQRCRVEDCCSYAYGPQDELNGLIGRYLEEKGITAPDRAVIAAAGPVSDNSVRFTNSNLVVDGGALVAGGRFKECRVVNDFAALAAALPLLSDSDLTLVGPAGQPYGERQLVVGPGTGLGAGCLIRQEGRYFVLDGEGGHIGFAPFDALERELLTWFAQHYGRVSVERLLTGRGLEQLYLALAQIKGVAVEELADHAIMTSGLQGDPHARQTLELFCALLGGFAGDLALAFCVERRVYIGGGIVPRMPDIFAAGQFRTRFEAKGRYEERMRTIPSFLITAEMPALQGAAFHLLGLHD